MLMEVGDLRACPTSLTEGSMSEAEEELMDRKEEEELWLDRQSRNFGDAASVTLT